MKRFFSIAAAVLVLAASTQSSFGGVYFKPTVNDRVVFSYPAGVGTAGAITGTTYSQNYTPGAPLGAATGTWTTFCVESLPAVEYYSPNKVYKVGSLTPVVTEVMANKVTDAAKWLYLQFVQGNLAGYTGTNQDKADLQNAIWSLVSTSASGYTQYLNYTNNANVTTWRNAAVGAAGLGYGVWSGSQYVGVMNPYSNDANGSTRTIQSFLYAVPEPGAIAVWSVLGLAGLGLVHFRRRRAR
jgi:hypothetical protein